MQLKQNFRVKDAPHVEHMYFDHLYPSHPQNEQVSPILHSPVPRKLRGPGQVFGTVLFPLHPAHVIFDGPGQDVVVPEQ